MNETGKKPLVGIAISLVAIVIIVAVTLLNQNRHRSGQSASQADTLTIGFDEPPRSADPRLIGSDANSQYLEELRFLPLVSFNEDGSLKYLIAESVTPKDDTTYVVKIRKGLKFANGDYVTPHDVVSTYEQILFPPGNFPPSPRKGAFSSVSAIMKTAPDEVTFALKAPDAAFPTNLVIGILPEKAAGAPPESLDGQGFESGPYVLSDKTDSLWALKRNDAFDGSAIGIPKPKISNVKFLIIRDETTRYAALIRGDIDILQNGLDADKIVSLKNNSEFQIQTRTRMSTDYIGFSTQKTPLKDPTVRLAIAHGINRDEILKFTLQNLAVKASGMFPKEFEWATDIPYIEYDPEKAKQLLDQANLPIHPGQKFRFNFTIKVTTNKTRIAIAKAIAAQLAAIGIGVEVESLEFGVFMDQLKEGAVSAWVASWTGYKDPDHLHFVFHSAMRPPEGGNRGSYSNSIVDDLLANGKMQPDKEKRKPIYQTAQEILASELPYVYLWHPYSIAVSKKEIVGFKTFSDGRYLSLPEVSRGNP